MTIYSPHAKDLELVPQDESAEPIRLTAHFYLAVAGQMPMLTLQRALDDPRKPYDFYRAVRLPEEITVEGVQVVNDGVSSQEAFAQIHTGRRILPAGSVLLVSFGESANPQWYGLTPAQVKDQGLLRAEARIDGNRISAVRPGCGLGMSIEASVQRSIIGGWSDDFQRAVQLSDIDATLRAGAITAQQMPSCVANWWAKAAPERACT